MFLSQILSFQMSILFEVYFILDLIVCGTPKCWFSEDETSLS